VEIQFLKAEVMLLRSLVVFVSRLYCFKTTFTLWLVKTRSMLLRSVFLPSCLC